MILDISRSKVKQTHSNSTISHGIRKGHQKEMFARSNLNEHHQYILIAFRIEKVTCITTLDLTTDEQFQLINFRSIDSN